MGLPDEHPHAPVVGLWRGGGADPEVLFVDLEPGPVRENDRALDHVLDLAYVSRPRIAPESLEGILRSLVLCVMLVEFSATISCIREWNEAEFGPRDARTD